MANKEMLYARYRMNNMTVGIVKMEHEEQANEDKRPLCMRPRSAVCIIRRKDGSGGIICDRSCCGLGEPADGKQQNRAVPLQQKSPRSIGC
jgi:hypothetical protein